MWEPQPPGQGTQHPWLCRAQQRCSSACFTLGLISSHSSWLPLGNCAMVCVLCAHSPCFVMSLHVERSWSYLSSPLWSIHVPLLLVATRCGLSLPLLHGALLVFPLCAEGVAGIRACLDCVPAIHYRGSCKHFSFSWGWASPPKGSVSARQGSRWDGAAPAPLPGPGSLLPAGSPHSPGGAATEGQRWEQQPCCHRAPRQPQMSLLGQGWAGSAQGHPACRGCSCRLWIYWVVGGQRSGRDAGWGKLNERTMLTQKKWC